MSFYVLEIDAQADAATKTNVLCILASAPNGTVLDRCYHVWRKPLLHVFWMESRLATEANLSLVRGIRGIKRFEVLSTDVVFRGEGWKDDRDDEFKDALFYPLTTGSNEVV